MAAVASGDRGACERLYRLSSPKLYGLVLRILRRPPLAAEAMRIAYGRIFAEAHLLRDGQDPVLWMVAIARSCALDIAREKEPSEPWDPFQPPLTAEDPLALPQRSAALKRLLASLGTLTEERRRLILLAYYDGWSREALSVLFDAPPATVRTWIARSAGQIVDGLVK